MLNHVVLMGRLTKDPDVRKTGSGTSVASFSLAVDRDFASRETGKRETDFINIVAWRSTADFVGKYFTKGQQVCVSGRLQVRQWQDKEGGNRYSTEVVADNVYFADSKREQRSEDSGFTPYNAPQASSYSDPSPVSDFSELDEDDGDLPF